MDTIASIATAPYKSAVGIVRMSGPEAIGIAGRVFTRADGRALSGAESHRLYYGDIEDAHGQTVDRCLCAVMRAPHSYTGEDTAEFYCHGSPAVLMRVLTLLCGCGARQAGPGEFTRRAFMSGKLDLAQAEAVADLIDARTEAAAKNAVSQLRGRLSERINDSYRILSDLTAHFRAEVDYPEEDVESLKREEIKRVLEAQQAALKKLTNGYDRGRTVTEGVRCAIVGRPNAGKSSVLNAILGYDRAIVNEKAGTTRDTIEEPVVLGRALLRLIDTAGIRQARGQTERSGVARALDAARGAQAVLLVVDRSRGGRQDITKLFARLEPDKLIVLLNKSDLEPKLGAGDFPGLPVFAVSAKTGEGFEALGEYLYERFSAAPEEEGELITNLRHRDCAEKARMAISRALGALADGLPPDLILTDAEDALFCLGQITGVNVSQDITDRIFARFCVGK